MGRSLLSLVTPYGLTFKTDKAGLVHMLEQHIDVEQPQLDLCTSVSDGNVVLQVSS